MAIVPIQELYQRGKYILRREGVFHFLKQSSSFVLTLLFSNGDYYIYEKVLNDVDEVELKPKESGYTLMTISTPSELDELVAEGYDFRMLISKSRLERGALAFCVLAGQELAHVTWVALNEEVKKEIDPLPFKVDFEAGEVCSGFSFTYPIHRGKGLFGYIYTCIFDYLHKENILKDKFTIEVSNLPSQKVMAKFKPIVTSKGRYLRILWWELWKEVPVEGARQ